MATPRFVVDAMLGRLSRWLRVLGFDSVYDPALRDAAMVRLAADEGRILLTRDRHLLRELRPPQAVELRHDAPLEQLQQLVRELALAPPPELFTRCLLCNTPLPPALTDAQAAPLVPPGFRNVHGPVRQCPGCGRVYWNGSHVRRMRAALERALPGWLGEAGHAGGQQVQPPP